MFPHWTYFHHAIHSGWSEHSQVLVTSDIAGQSMPSALRVPEAPEALLASTVRFARFILLPFCYVEGIHTCPHISATMTISTHWPEP